MRTDVGPRVVRALASVVLSISALASVPAAHAQAPELHPIRESLTTYALDDGRTLTALRELGAAIERASSEDARREARFLRAAVATDLLIAAAIDPSHAALEGAVAEALGVPRAELTSHLRSELTAQRGVYRAPARNALSALSLRDSLAEGDDAATEWSRHRGSRRDLLLLRAAADAIVPSMGHDPCTPSGCPEPYAALAPSARRELAALVEVRAALDRVQEAARSGDPLAQSLLAHARPAAARIAATVVRPAPRVPASLPIQPGAAAGEPMRPGLLIAIGEDAVHLTRAPSYGVRDGRVAAREAGDDVLPGSASIALPTELSPGIRPLDALVEALRARGPIDGPIAIAAAPDVPAHVIARVLTSAIRAGRAPTTLVLRAPDGTLRGAPITLAPRDELGAAGDLVVRVRLGGYGVTRGRGSAITIPRVRREAGLAFDLDALAAMVERVPHRRVALEWMATVRAAEIFDAAFRIGGSQPVGGGDALLVAI